MGLMVGHCGRGGEQACQPFPRFFVLCFWFARFSVIMVALGRKMHGLMFGLGVSGTVARPGLVAPVRKAFVDAVDVCTHSAAWLS